MTKFFLTSAVMIALMPAIAHAEDPNERWTGLKAGIEASRDRLSIAGDSGNIGAGPRSARNGVGYRGFVGYDVQIGGVVIGGEAGIAGGDRTAIQNGTRGQYLVNPGLSYDLSARAGVVVAPGVLVYGRAGHRWLQTDRTTIAANGTRSLREQTDGGITYGGGAEFQIGPHFLLRAEYMRTPYDRQLKSNRFAIGAGFRF